MSYKKEIAEWCENEDMGDGCRWYQELTEMAEWQDRILAAKDAEIAALREALEEIKDALFETNEYENYECSYGPTLGTCTNKDCLHCRVHRATKDMEATK